MRETERQINKDQANGKERTRKREKEGMDVEEKGRKRKVERVRQKV